jgi:hypothetical protein
MPGGAAKRDDDASAREPALIAIPFLPGPIPGAASVAPPDKIGPPR